MNHYDVLGIPHTADRDQIEEAHRRRVDYLTARLQTTRFADGRQEVLDLLQEVGEAHRVLSDPHRRMAYDLSLAPEPAASAPRAIKLKRDDTPPIDPAVRSVQWVHEKQRPDEPVPTLAPPPEPGPGWDRRWVWAIAGVGLLAFIVGLAFVTGGLRPVVVGPTAPPTEAPRDLPAPPAQPAGPVGDQFTP